MDENFDLMHELFGRVNFTDFGEIAKDMNQIQECIENHGYCDELYDFNMSFSGCNTLTFHGYKIKVPNGMVIDNEMGSELHAYLPGDPFERLLVRHVNTITINDVGNTDYNIADIMDSTIERILAASNMSDNTVHEIQTANSCGKYYLVAGNAILYMLGYNCIVIYRIMANCSTKRLHEIVRFIASGIEPDNGLGIMPNAKNTVNRNSTDSYDLNTMTIFSKAIERMNDAVTENDFRAAAALFNKIPHYMDSKELGRKCLENARNAKMDNMLNSALKKITETDNRCSGTDGYIEAMDILKKIPGWKNADSLINECKDKILQMGIESMTEAEDYHPINDDYYMDAIEIFEKIPGWKNADLLINECKDKILQMGIEAMTETEDYHPAYDDYMTAVWTFEDISGWKNADSLLNECKDKILQMGIEAMTETEDYHPTYDDYMTAIEIFEEISGWKNADSLIDDCENKIEEIKEKEEIRNLEDKLEKKRRTMRKFITVIILVCTVIILTLLWKNLIYPPIRYNRAVGFMESEKYEEAVEVFESMETYKDSEERIDKCYSMICGEEKWNEIKAVKIGRIYKFGKYEQDGDPFNGKEEIEWKVLDKKGTKILVISWYILDEKQYKHSYQATETTWEKSSIRKWLNNSFLKYAFSADEIAMIQTVTVPADKNPQYDTSPGNATQDKIFLLSMTEVEKYFGSSSHMEALKTENLTGPYAYDSSGEWWLRTPGFEQYNAVTVYCDSGIDEMGEHTHNYYGVRPAMWIDLNS